MTHEELLAAFDALPVEEKVAALKRAGILDADGQLAARYCPQSHTTQANYVKTWIEELEESLFLSIIGRPPVPKAPASVRVWYTEMSVEAQERAIAKLVQPTPKYTPREYTPCPADEYWAANRKWDNRLTPDERHKERLAEIRAEESLTGGHGGAWYGTGNNWS